MDHGLASVDGRILKLSEASLPLRHRAIFYGEALFESIVCYHGKPLNLARHIRRLIDSAEDLGWPLTWNAERLEAEARMLAEAEIYPKAALRILLSPDSGPGLRPTTMRSLAKVLTLSPLTRPELGPAEQGLRLKSQASPYSLPGARPKRPDYFYAIKALRAQSSLEIDDILWLNAEQELSECSSANIFLLGREGDQLLVYTPSVETGLLNGITRQFLIELLRGHEIPVYEEKIRYEELARFDEAFLSSSLSGLRPVALIDHHKLHSMRSQSMFRQIHRLFRAACMLQLGLDCQLEDGSRT